MRSSTGGARRWAWARATWCSTGNEADLGALEVAAYLLEDSATDVIALLVEGFRPDETLAPVAARAAELGKKLVVAKLGRSAARAAGRGRSHRP